MIINDTARSRSFEDASKFSVLQNAHTGCGETSRDPARRLLKGLAPVVTEMAIFTALPGHEDELARAIGSPPFSRLDAARRLREAAEELEAAEVVAARKAGATWIENAR
jgi:hypothetical protein